MTNPFHSFHVQKGGVPLKKLSKHYQKLSKNKTKKFQPLTLQEREDLVVPMDLLHVPHHTCHSQKPEEYYVYPETHTPPIQGTLEVIEIHTIPQEQSYEHPPVISDEQFDNMFQSISTTPRPKKHFKSNHTLKKQKKNKRKSGKSKRD